MAAVPGGDHRSDEEDDGDQESVREDQMNKHFPDMAFLSLLVPDKHSGSSWNTLTTQPCGLPHTLC